MRFIHVGIFLTTIVSGAFFVQIESVFPPKGSPPSSMSMCGPADRYDADRRSDGKYVALLPGWGNYQYKITTDHDSAQYYFNQGLNMYYSYHMKEATASFKEAARFDSGCAMAYWGEALSLGPYYNAAHTYVKPERVVEVLARMNQNMDRTSEKEKNLIRAMNIRYDPTKGGDDKKTSDAAYANELKELIGTYPQDQDIKMLYVDAVMLMYAWDFWDQEGNARSWTPEVISISESVIKINPEHPAALHYHIHLTEASHQPEVALPNAHALKELFPGVPHMVHMASHEYQRNGLYADGVAVNDLADDNLRTYDAVAKNLMLNTQSPHYFAVQTYCALSGGMYEKGMQSAMKCRKSVTPNSEATYDQYLYMMPVMTMVRLGKWEQILLDETAPETSWSYAQLLRHFALGMAQVHTNRSDSAAWHLSKIKEKMKDPVLLKRRVPFNAPAQIAPVAEQILQAAIHFSRHKNKEGIAALQAAIAMEDKLIYTEPNDWPLPARQFLGANLLKMKRFNEAELVFREDLVRNPGNGWSNLGLYQCLLAQGKNKNLNEYKAAYVKAFSHADEMPGGAVF